MDNRADPEDRPYHLRQAPRSGATPTLVGVVVAAAAAGAAYWWFDQGREPPASSRPPEIAAKPAPKAEPPTAIQYPVRPPQSGESLPALDASDTLAGKAIAALIGGKAFADLVISDGVVRRIVATVDNLPRPVAPRRVFPVQSVPGALVVTGRGENLALSPANAARYSAYLRAFDSMDAAALVNAYVRLYPLFQRAYEELGFPGRHFNDRLVVAIDDMLAAPEVAPPILLLQPKVLYEFADSGLETRSAGQKILLRMGRENAARAKAKLREIRRELLAVSRPQKS